jgi:hypothetical protein
MAEGARQREVTYMRDKMHPVRPGCRWGTSSHFDRHRLSGSDVRLFSPLNKGVISIAAAAAGNVRRPVAREEWKVL